MKRKGKLASTGHGTGALQERTLRQQIGDRRLRRVGLGVLCGLGVLGNSWPCGKRDRRGRSVPAKKRDYYRKRVPDVDLAGEWKLILGTAPERMVRRGPRNAPSLRDRILAASSAAKAEALLAKGEATAERDGVPRSNRP